MTKEQAEEIVTHLRMLGLAWAESTRETPYGESNYLVFFPHGWVGDYPAAKRHTKHCETLADKARGIS